MVGVEHRCEPRARSGLVPTTTFRRDLTRASYPVTAPFRVLLA